MNRSLLALAALILIPETVSAQEQQRACYIPGVGAVYRIGEAGLPAECLEATHVEFSWEPAGHNHTVDNLQGNAVSEVAPSHGDLLRWDALSGWVPVAFRLYTNEELFLVPAGSVGLGEASCDQGDSIVSGGYALTSGPGLLVTDSRPVGESDWQIRAFNEFSTDTRVTVYARCLDLQGPYPPLP